MNEQMEERLALSELAAGVSALTAAAERLEAVAQALSEALPAQGLGREAGEAAAQALLASGALQVTVTLDGERVGEGTASAVSRVLSEEARLGLAGIEGVLS